MRQTLEKREIEEKIINEALAEDLGKLGDITTDSIISKDLSSTYNMVVNEDAILGGLEVFKKTFQLLDNEITIRSDFYDGDEIKKNSVIATVCGNTRNILKGERTALNFLCHLSGIATITRLLVRKISNTRTKLLDTRKTTPNLRFFEKQAILAGGAFNHRFNLSEMILIKDNHIASAGGIKNAIMQVKKSYGEEIKIEVEVTNINELNEAIPFKPSVIMFDNWVPSELQKALKLVPNDILAEASGQITLENIIDYAKTGVNYISTSYMIKHANWVDFSLNAC